MCFFFTFTGNFVIVVFTGVWRSLVARTAGGREVAGSNPVAPINPYFMGFLDELAMKSMSYKLLLFMAFCYTLFIYLFITVKSIKKAWHPRF